MDEITGAELYQTGDNLLTKTAGDFYPQVQPVRCQLFLSDFSEDLTPYYQQFSAYYEKGKRIKFPNSLSPAFYTRILSVFMIE